MTKFIGRKTELSLLNEVKMKRSASLIVVKGRRRIGKSRLLEEFGKSFSKLYIFAGLPPTEKTTDASQRGEFGNQLKNYTQNDPKPGDWTDLFYQLSRHTQKGSVLIILDEISWMGSQDPDFLGKLKNAWDLYLKKNDQLILAISGSCTTWIDKNILSSTGFLGRESLTLTLEELPLYDCNQFWGFEAEKISAFEKLKFLSVTGGIPRYLESLQPARSSEDNIQALCFNPSGILFNEFDKIFSDLFSARSTLYKKIIKIISEGAKDQASLCKQLGLQPGGDIAEYLNDLIQSGFISRDFTWNIKDGKESNLSTYRLKDNYSRFYLHYIEPNRRKIEAGNMTQTTLSNLAGWTSIMGLQIENLIISNRQHIKKALQLDSGEIVCDNPFFQRQTSKQQGVQIDYLIQTKYKTLYICEIKTSKNEIGPQIIEEVNEKIHRLKIPKHFSIRTVLIHINGVSEALEEKQYFSHIIDVGSLLLMP